jgi:hypothetical protein
MKLYDAKQIWLDTMKRAAAYYADSITGGDTIFFCFDCKKYGKKLQNLRDCTKSGHQILKIDARRKDAIIVTRDREFVETVMNKPVTSTDVQILIQLYPSAIVSEIQIGRSVILITELDRETIEYVVQNRILLEHSAIDIYFILIPDLLTKGPEKVSEDFYNLIVEKCSEKFSKILESELGKEFLQRFIELVKKKNPFVEAYYRALTR